ncbi:phage antirepressor protein [Mycobacteroides abscessus subsp. massiliense]|uniref:Rha family transcriptional regulator n=1 Tax=Mycobacteroides abscessus TaxID=36809 RepID=UPI0009A7E2AD|nr:Rha family transcriptional regulator [Mycobacteroides abscessus]SKS09971.1 phage antirepressor protein [Mycobacteroides abscessus subsp. massiliense]
MSDLEPTNSELVFAGSDGEPFTTSLVIATETGNQHKNVLGLIRGNIDDLNELGGLVAFQTRPREVGQHGGGDTEFAVLNEPQSALLITYMRNNEVVRDFKKRLVAGFYAMRQQLTNAAPVIELPNTRQLAQMVIDAEDAREAAELKSKMLQAAIDRDAPLVAKAEAHTGSDSTVHRQEFSREVIAWGRKQNVEIRQEQVMRFLGHIGLFIRGERTDTGHATSDAIKRGLAFTDKGTAKNGHAWATGKLTARGQDYAWKRIAKYVAEHRALELPRELRGGDPA